MVQSAARLLLSCFDASSRQQGRRQPEHARVRHNPDKVTASCRSLTATRGSSNLLNRCKRYAYDSESPSCLGSAGRQMPVQGRATDTNRDQLNGPCQVRVKSAPESRLSRQHGNPRRVSSVAVLPSTAVRKIPLRAADFSSISRSGFLNLAALRQNGQHHRGERTAD